MSVGVRELKAKLSEYLRRVEAGEVITVTEHGRPKAIISPVAGGSRYERGVAEGWITPATRQELPRPRPVRGRMPSQQVLDEDRGD